jgi:Bacterial membrane protein YfhO
VRRLFNPERLRARRADVAALAAIALFFVAFFPQGLFGGKYLLAGDDFFYSYPMRTVAWRMLRQGILPLWSPYTLSGYPLLSMTQLGLGYPLTWGHLFLPAPVAEQVYVLAPFLLVPVFTYFYARTLGRSPLAALLAGLSFGYGGMMASPLGNSGMMTNAGLWLPLFLLAIEWARTRRFVPCLLLATGAYALCVLNGFGQGFLYVGLLALAYALYVSLTVPAPHAAGRAPLRRLSSIQTWRPALVACGAGLLAAGVAAFQILETARVVRRSVRHTLSYELFTQGSFPPAYLWKSFTTPFFYVIDMHAYVPPLAAVLALVAVWAHTRRRAGRDPRVFFWLAVAALACVLMMGGFTPFYRVVYRLPLLNLFRVPSRHTFEWTFAVSLLAAYGWDALAARLGQQRATRAHTPALTLYAALVLLLLSVGVGALWWLKLTTLPFVGDVNRLSPQTIYQLWKGVFVLLTLVALWRASLIAQPRWRAGLLLSIVLVLCYVEPSAIIARWWGHGFAAARFSAVSDATRYLQQFPPEQGRVYTRVELMSEQHGEPPRFDGPNLSAVYGLHNVAGYEPLILERYSRALGGAWLNAVYTLADGKPDPSLLTEQSHVLDILNTAYLVSYSNLEMGYAPGSASGAAADMKLIGEVLPHEARTLTAPPTEATALLFITSLSNSTLEPDGQRVARLRVITTDGGVIEHELQAGRDTAEWAHERREVRAVIKHKLAPIFDSKRVDDAGGYTAYRYQALVPLAGPVRVSRVEITNVSQTARLGIYGAALVEARTRRNVPLTESYSAAWQPVYEQRETLILRNTRALPRAWLVAEAEAVDGEEALRQIRGEEGRAFEPRRTALLEVRREELPRLPGGDLAPESTARVVAYEPNRLRIETHAPTATVLVVSEIFYPGWEATVDGQPAHIMAADFLLRAVALPAGEHRIEMRYTAPGARAGAAISALTLCLLVGLALVAWRARATRG